MAIDWVENPIGFVPDGSSLVEAPEQHTLNEGPYGHLCAYPPGSEKLIEQHAKQRQHRGNESITTNAAGWYPLE